MQWFEQNLAAADKQFHITLNERTDASNKRLDELSERITELDKKRIEDKEEILKQIEITGLELKQMLAEFKVRNPGNMCVYIVPSLPTPHPLWGNVILLFYKLIYCKIVSIQRSRPLSFCFVFPVTFI